MKIVATFMVNPKKQKEFGYRERVTAHFQWNSCHCTGFPILNQFGFVHKYFARFERWLYSKAETECSQLPSSSCSTEYLCGFAFELYISNIFFFLCLVLSPFIVRVCESRFCVGNLGSWFLLWLQAYISIQMHA